jgi:hypothetical protein
MIFLRNSIILLLLIVVAASCSHEGIDWNPDFYVGDSHNQQIINEEGITIMCDQPEFNKYACLSEDKVKELIEILTNAEIPLALKEKILKTMAPVMDTLQ